MPLTATYRGYESSEEQDYSPRNQTLNFSRTSGRYLLNSDEGSSEEMYGTFEKRENRYETVVAEDSVSVNGTESDPLLVQKDKHGLYKGRQMFVLIACLILQYISLGLATALGVIYVELVREFNSPRKVAALVQSLYMGLTYACGCLFTHFFSKYSVGLCMVVGSAVGGTGMLISSFATNIYMVLAFAGVVAGVGMSICNLGSSITINRTFRNNRKIALGLLTTANTFGQMTFPPLSQYLVQEYSWKGTFLMIGGILYNGIACGLFIHFSQHIFTKESTESKEGKSVGMTVLLKDFTIDMVLIYQLILVSTGAVESLFVVDVSVMRGLSLATGSLFLTVMGATGIGGRSLGALLPRLFPHSSLTVHAVYSSLIGGLSHFLVIYLQDVAGMMGAVTLRGVFLGVSLALVPGLLIEISGPEKFPQAMALVNIASGVGQIASGFVGGAIVDATGDYFIVFCVAAGGGGLCALLGCGMYLRLKLT